MIRILTFILTLMTSTKVAWGNTVKLDVQNFDDVTHLEFTGHEDWNVTRQKDGKEFAFEITKLEPAAVVQLKTLKNKYISKVEIESGTDGRDKIRFKLANDQVQAFDYITDQPSRVILDFFVAEAEKKPVAKKETRKEKIKTTSRSDKSRKPASDFKIGVPASQGEMVDAPQPTFGVFDGADPEYSRFDMKDYEIREDAIIASRRNLYIKFPMLNQAEGYLAKILEHAPKYEVAEENNDENKKARLLLTLFKNKRFIVFLRTLELFRDEYSESKFKDMLEFMEADAYYGIWLKDQKLADFEMAMSKYRQLVHKYPDHELVERTLLLVGFSLFERGDYLGAYTEFQRFVRERSKSPYYSPVKMTMADSLVRLSKFEDALKMLDDIESDPAMGTYSVSARYKRGDIHYLQDQYEKAISSYGTARKKSPEFESEHPNAFYNAAESYFWLGQYKKSLDTYREFIRKFPSSTHGGYAMTRLGELLEILGAKPEKITGAFLESIFRYNGSPGAGVANIRLLGYRIPLKAQKEIDDQLKTIDQFAKTSDLPRIQDFKTVMISDGYFNKKEYQKSYDLLVDFYRQNPTSNNLDVIKDRIVRNLAEQIWNRTHGNDYLGAIQIYGQHSSGWLKNSDRFDLQYNIAQSFENTGVLSEAESRYKQILNRRYSIQNSTEEKERAVFERLPSVDSLNLRLAHVQYGQDEYSKAKDSLDLVRDETLPNDSEKIEKVYLASEINEKMNQKPLAIENLRQLAERFSNKPEELSKVHLRLGRLLAEEGDATSAEKSFNRIVKLAEDSKVVSDDVLYEALERKSDLLLASNKKQEAISSYKNLLSSFEDKIPSAPIRYRLGKIYFEMGNLVEAEKTWGPLAGKKDSELWNKLAQEQLAQSKWEKEYNKYVNRIPAMAKPEAANNGEGVNESGQK